MPVLSMDGAELHYHIAGDGPPLLMIAGLSSDSASWGPVAPALSKQFTLIMPDNRGAGRTKAKGAISIDAMARDCTALLDHLSIARTHVLGHSMGGTVAASLAASQPDRTESIVLAASPAAPPARAISVVENILALREHGAPGEHWLRALFHWLFAPRFFENRRAVDAAIATALAYPHAQSASDMRRQIEALRRHDASTLPERVAAPGLLLAGELDLMVSPEAIAESFAGAPKMRLQTLAGAAHSLHWDQPEAFVHAVTDFFRPDNSPSRRRD